MPINKNQLLEQRGDLSQFLIHLTRSGDLKIYKDIYPSSTDTFIQMTARESLAYIIQTKRIEAKSPFGYFNYKVPMTRANGKKLNPNSKVQRDWLRAVCFTETPLDHVHLQMQEIFGRQLHFEPYGLAFKESSVRRANGNPVFYVETSNRSMRQAFDEMVETPLADSFKTTMPLIEGFGAPWFSRWDGPPEIDFRWEREWRVVGDYSFTESDIAFGLCPEPEIQSFESHFAGRVPFVDPTKNIEAAKLKLRKSAHLAGLK